MSELEHDPASKPPARARRDPLGLAELLGPDSGCVPLSDYDGAELAGPAPASACSGCTAPCPSDFVPLEQITHCSHARNP